LSTGCTILLNVKVYLTRKAFEKADKANREENGTFWQEQKETMEEEVMRHRKEALGLLFGVYTNRGSMLMDLRPYRRQGYPVKCATRRTKTEWICSHKREIAPTL